LELRAVDADGAESVILAADVNVCAPGLHYHKFMRDHFRRCFADDLTFEVDETVRLVDLGMLQDILQETEYYSPPSLKEAGIEATASQAREIDELLQSCFRKFVARIESSVARTLS
jgi:hypothetical protein